MDEFNAPVGPCRQFAQDIVVKNEGAEYAPSASRRFGQRRAVVIAQIAAKPDENRVHHINLQKAEKTATRALQLIVYAHIPDREHGRRVF